MYLGRVNRVAAIYSEVKELIDEDISLEIDIYLYIHVCGNTSNIVGFVILHPINA